jgi:hypothetical protein
VATSKNLKAPKTGDDTNTCKKLEVKVIKKLLVVVRGVIVGAIVARHIILEISTVCAVVLDHLSCCIRKKRSEILVAQSYNGGLSLVDNNRSTLIVVIFCYASLSYNNITT